MNRYDLIRAIPAALVVAAIGYVSILVMATVGAAP